MNGNARLIAARRNAPIMSLRWSTTTTGWRCFRFVSILKQKCNIEFTAAGIEHNMQGARCFRVRSIRKSSFSLDLFVIDLDETRTTAVSMARFWPLMLFALVSAMAVALGISNSYADGCSALRRQMISAGRGTAASPELAQLRRQLTAIQGIERQRRCTAGNATGGFFNACGDLAKNRTEVQRQITNAANSGRDPSGLQARFVALGCGSAAKQEQQQQPRPVKTQSSGVTLGGNAMLFCVRRSDGYFFPAPKSQFAESDDLKDTVDQCRYICDDAGVDLYTLDDASRETEDMISLETRKPYTELPAAFRYRDDVNFRACDVKRYYQRVTELRARTVTPADMTNAIIPLPTAKPEPGASADGAVAQALVSQAGGQGAVQHQSIERLVGTRPVRVVGPAFFPEE